MLAVLGAGELRVTEALIWSILEGFCALPALVLMMKDAAAGESALVMPVRLISRCVAWHMSCNQQLAREITVRVPLAASSQN